MHNPDAGPTTGNNESIIFILTQLTQKMDWLTQTIDDLSHKTDALTLQLGSLTASCSRMDTHIDFVDTVYSTVRRPLDIVLNLVSGGSAARPLLPPNGQLEEATPLE
jgi:hypothetical protein